MPHDKRGEELKVGDTVMVPCVIKAIHLTEDYCNVDLETRLFMPPLDTTTTLTLNSRQTIKPTASHSFYEYGKAGAAPTPPQDWRAKRCGVVHAQTGATCEKPAEHIENHIGSYLHGTVQWPKDGKL